MGSQSGAAEASVPVLTGPTGSGKSHWAMRLAEGLPVEIVSVDSAQVYRGLDIGSAKPTRADRARVAHHLIDIRDPAEPYSAGEFVADARRLVAEIRSRGHLPLLVGGTMLYLRSLRRGLASLPMASPLLRERLAAQAAEEGWPALHRELARIDAPSAARIHPNDAQRIQRALEVYMTTGRPMTAWHAGEALIAPLPCTLWALNPERGVLHERIEQRFRAMMSAGLLEEVRALRARGDLTADHPAMRAVGYRQLWAHLEGAYGLEEAIARGVAATRQLSKRQTTWLRSEHDAILLDPAAPDAFELWRERIVAVERLHGPGRGLRGTI
jgi:tRNA dimethylallyltransferase